MPVIRPGQRPVKAATVTVRPAPPAKGARGPNCILHTDERPLSSRFQSLINGMPGFHKWDGWQVVFRPIGANVDYVRENWPDCVWLDGSEEHLQRLAEVKQRAASIVGSKGGSLRPIESDDYEYSTVPYEHQRRAFLISRDVNNFALLMEQRTGKTKVTLDTAGYLYRKNKIHTVIVISIKGVHRNWIDNELPKHLPWVDHYYFQKSNHSVRQQKAFEAVFVQRGKKLCFFAFNVEAFSRDGVVSKLFERVLGDGSGVMIVIDESTRIKNHSAKRTKYLTNKGRLSDYRRILTGTFITKNPMDAYGQYKFLDPEILGYDTSTAYKSHFCVTVPDPNDERREIIVRGKNLEELSELIAGHSFRVLRRDCMDMPEKVYQRWPVEMTTQQEKLYAAMRDEYIAEFNGKTVSATLAMTRYIRLQQILCGWWPMADDDLHERETWKNVRPIMPAEDNPRIQALLEALEDVDEKVIIWSRFRPDLHLIQSILGGRAVGYHGGIKSDDQRARNLRAFQCDPKIDRMVANQASAGLGLDMSVAGMHLYYCNSFDLEQRLQSEDRTESLTKKDHTLVVDFEVPGTVDSRTIKNLKSKKDVASLIMRDPRALFMEEDNGL